MLDRYVLRRLLQRDKLERVFVERLTEPLHLNVLAAFVWLFGSFRMKVAFDLVVRQQYAFPILHVAERAREFGKQGVTIIEFGVASGAGLLNMCKIAQHASKSTGIEFQVFGFDTGTGLPPPQDYRDYPEAYRGGDFPMEVDRLRAALPSFATLLIGDIKDTVPGFLEDLSIQHPIGFIAIDVDYYSSAKHTLTALCGPPDKYLPRVIVYLDDIGDEYCSPWTGELLAIDEFNREQPVRRIAPFPMLRSRRIFKSARWIDQIFMAHIHDHELRSIEHVRGGRRVITNEYIESAIDGGGG